MNWHWWILEKGASVVRGLARLSAWIFEDLQWRQLVDFAVLALFAAGVGLVSVWVGAMVLFIAVVMLLQRRAALPVSRMVANEVRDSDERWDEFWDSPGRRHANMTHEYSYRAFEDD